MTMSEHTSLESAKTMLCALTGQFAHQTYLQFYQSPLILTELFQHNLINVSYLTACYLYQVMMTLHFLNDVANDAKSTQNLKLCPNR